MPVFVPCQVVHVDPTEAAEAAMTAEDKEARKKAAKKAMAKIKKQEAKVCQPDDRIFYNL